MIVALLHPQFLNRAGTKTVQTTACRESDWSCIMVGVGPWGLASKNAYWGCFLRQETQTLRVFYVLIKKLVPRYRRQLSTIERLQEVEVACFLCRFDSLPQRNEDLPFHIIVGPTVDDSNRALRSSQSVCVAKE